jgi:hypothetical protein
VIDVEIDARGKVSSASTVSGHPLLAQIAEKNIRTWEFDASSSEARRLTVTYQFVLEPPEARRRRESRNLFDLPTRVTIVSNYAQPQP